MIMGVLYVDYRVEAVSFRNKKKQREGKALKMITVGGDRFCECRVVNKLAFLIPRVNLLVPRILPRVMIIALALIQQCSNTVITCLLRT